MAFQPLVIVSPAGQSLCMIPIPALLSEPFAAETLAFLRSAVPEPVANHCIRSYVYAELLVDRWRMREHEDYHPLDVFYAVTLHDVGLGREGARRSDRFEVAGADLAGEFLQRRGVDQAQIDRIWDAIALNTSTGIAHRRNLLCRVTAVSSGVDFGADSDFVTDDMATDLHSRYPRLRTASSMKAAIVGQAKANPAKAPLASLALYLLTTENMSQDENIAARWGD
ncbi:cyanamide hydratase [Amorphoplanes auranticolor]|uniref:Cyanamide hydratase n=1 Tax=Actinoplanes auranticolor TaxID=47988 RepID=A0A919SHG7_9ACTN|nr:cyanamide hydratase [Actinoplanes auranticolor]